MKEYKNYIAEFLGTFGLVFIGGAAILVNSLTNGTVGLVGIAFAHGLVLMMMIYSLANISGAHFNPAVTIAMLINKRIDIKKAAAYILSQLGGSLVAAFFLKILYPTATSAMLYGFPTTLQMTFGIMVEAILTFFLVFAIYGTALNKKAPSGFFGLVIGSTIVLDILVGGTQTGAAMNPARTFGPAVFGGFLNNQPIYWIGPIIGAVVASLLCEYLHKE
jgi:MIP family channel proteins